MRIETFCYGIPINEQEGDGTVTVLWVSIKDNNPIRRGAKLMRILKQNYGMKRADAKKALRAMEFDTIVI